MESASWDDWLIMAKLTTDQRKALPAKAFCGPNRSFPVTDLVHARAAKAFLPRANLSSVEKKKVLACVIRKENQLKKT